MLVVATEKEGSYVQMPSTNNGLPLGPVFISVDGVSRDLRSFSASKLMMRGTCTD